MTNYRYTIPYLWCEELGRATEGHSGVVPLNVLLAEAKVGTFNAPNYMTNYNTSAPDRVGSRG
jgi:hypothetical protein